MKLNQKKIGSVRRRLRKIELTRNLILLLSEEGEHKKYHQSPPVNSNAERRKRVSEREKKSKRRKKKFPLTHSRIFPLCATVFGELELSKHTEENREKNTAAVKEEKR